MQYSFSRSVNAALWKALGGARSASFYRAENDRLAAENLALMQEVASCRAAAALQETVTDERGYRFISVLPQVEVGPAVDKRKGDLIRVIRVYHIHKLLILRSIIRVLPSCVCFLVEQYRFEQSIGKFMGDPPRRYDSAKGPAKLEGCIFEIDPESGKCLKAEAIRI